MTKTIYLSSKNVLAGAVLALGLMGNSAFAACTTALFGTVSAGNCVADVNANTTGLATTNTNLATTNAKLTAGDAATLTSSKAYTDAKALSVGADTLAAANNYTNAKSEETLKSANTYTDTRVAETLKSANTFTSEQVAKLDSKTSAGIASIAAMANIPAPTTAGKNFSIGVAVGTYDGQTAIAFGGQKRFGENGLARIGISGSTGKGSKIAAGAGAAWEF